MRNSKLLCKLLQLKEMKVTWFQFADYGKELRLGVKPFKNGCRCPDCDRRGRVARRIGEARQWRDVTILGIRIILFYAPRGDRLSDAWCYPRGHSLGSGSIPGQLPAGVPDLRFRPDHDAESGGGDSGDAVLHTVGRPSSGHHPDTDRSPDSGAYHNGRR